MKTLREWLESLDTEKITAAYINSEYRMHWCKEGVRITSKYPPDELATYIQAEVRRLILLPFNRSHGPLVFFARKQYSGPFPIEPSLCSLASLAGTEGVEPIPWWYLSYAEIMDAYIAETTLTIQNISELIVLILLDKENYSYIEEDLADQCPLNKLEYFFREHDDGDYEEWKNSLGLEEADLIDELDTTTYYLNRYYYRLAVEDVKKYLQDAVDVDSILSSKPSCSRPLYYQERINEFM